MKFQEMSQVPPVSKVLVRCTHEYDINTQPLVEGGLNHLCRQNRQVIRQGELENGSRPQK